MGRVLQDWVLGSFGGCLGVEGWLSKAPGKSKGGWGVAGLLLRVLPLKQLVTIKGRRLCSGAPRFVVAAVLPSVHACIV
jgi:hypothetical protein